MTKMTENIPVDGNTELRLLQEADADALFALHIGFDRFSTIEGVRGWLATVCQLRREGVVLPYGIWSDGGLVGYVNLEFGDIALVCRHPATKWQWIYQKNGITAGRDAQIHYGLAPSSRGHGVVTRSASCLIQNAFAGIGVALIRATIPIDNSASCAVVQRLGFEDEGMENERCKNYLMTKQEWERQKIQTPPQPTGAGDD